MKRLSNSLESFLLMLSSSLLFVGKNIFGFSYVRARSFFSLYHGVILSFLFGNLETNSLWKSFILQHSEQKAAIVSQVPSDSFLLMSWANVTNVPSKSFLFFTVFCKHPRSFIQLKMLCSKNCISFFSYASMKWGMEFGWVLFKIKHKQIRKKE